MIHKPGFERGTIGDSELGPIIKEVSIDIHKFVVINKLPSQFV